MILSLDSYHDAVTRFWREQDERERACTHEWRRVALAEHCRNCGARRSLLWGRGA